MTRRVVKKRDFARNASGVILDNFHRWSGEWFSG